MLRWKLPLGFTFALASCSLFDTEPRHRHVTTRLPHAEGLGEGSEVVMAGLTVGRVTSVDTLPCGVELRLEINRLDAPLTEGVRAEVRPSGLLSRDMIVLIPPPRVTPPLADGARVPGAPRATIAAERRAAWRTMGKLLTGEGLNAFLPDSLDSLSVHPRPDTATCRDT